MDEGFASNDFSYEGGAGGLMLSDGSAFLLGLALVFLIAGLGYGLFRWGQWHAEQKALAKRKDVAETIYKAVEAKLKAALCATGGGTLSAAQDLVLELKKRLGHNLEMASLLSVALSPMVDILSGKMLEDLAKAQGKEDGAKSDAAKGDAPKSEAIEARTEKPATIYVPLNLGGGAAAAAASSAGGAAAAAASAAGSGFGLIGQATVVTMADPKPAEKPKDDKPKGPTMRDSINQMRQKLEEFAVLWGNKPMILDMIDGMQRQVLSTEPLPEPGVPPKPAK